MIVYRQTDRRFPFLWEDTSQPAGRWHGEGEGPAHYFADTPAGAWAEFLRHEEITSPDDLPTIHRQIWAVDVGDETATPVRVPHRVATGNLESYPQCQLEARRLRANGTTRLRAPSAALKSGAARGTVVRGGAHDAPPRDGTVIVVFGAPDRMVGYEVAASASPPADLLERVRHYGA